MHHGPGLLKPFPTQIWMSVGGRGRIQGVGSCALIVGLVEAVEKSFVWFYVGYILVADRDVGYPF